MRAGSLNHRLVLESPAPTRESDGGMVEAYTTVATVWGSLDGVNGRETFDSGKIVSEATHKAYIRFRTDIKPTWRVSVSEGTPAVVRRFAVVAVINARDGRKDLQLMLKEMPSGEAV